MLEEIHLQGVGPAPEMRLEVLPRFNLLTGDNGLGKTFLLDIAWWALTRTWAGTPAWPDPETAADPQIHYRVSGPEGPLSFTSRYRFETQSWELPESRKPMPGLVLYARVDGSFSVWDPARNYWEPAPEGGRWERQERPTAYHFTPLALWDGLNEGKRVLCNGLIQDWVSWQHQDSEAFDQLRDVLRILSPGEVEELKPGQPIRVRVDDVRPIPTLDMPYGRVPLTHASAGVRRVVSLAYLLVWAWQEHREASRLRRREPTDEIVFLVDEVEGHLHPRWQRLILPSLAAVAGRLQRTTAVQLLVTTHAPLVLASMEPLFDTARDKLTQLSLDEGQVRVEELPWTKQGDAANWLVSETFGLSQARSYEAERAIEAAEAFMRGDAPSLPPDLRSSRAIHAELQRVLAGHDPFWARWIVAQTNGQGVIK